ncbi:MAG: hypothetical protein AAF628_26620 [Planctomycetota bacterium]
MVHPLRHRRGDYSDLTVEIAKDGRFRCELGERHEHDSVAVRIYDTNALVFSGMLVVREALDIMVSSTHDEADPLLGTLTLPGVREDDRYWLVATCYSGNQTCSVASSGDGRSFQGIHNEVRLFHQSPLLRGVTAKTVLIAMERDRQGDTPEDWFFRRVMGHAEFESVEHLNEALCRGIVINTPLRRVEFAGKLFLPESFPQGLLSASKVILVPVCSRNAFYMGRIENGSTCQFYAPDGDYFVSVVGDAVRHTAKLSIAGGQLSYRVHEWFASIPGEERVEIVAVDAQGNAIREAQLRYAAMDGSFRVHSGVERHSVEGRFLVEGLMGLEYVFQVCDQDGSIGCVGRGNPAETDTMVLSATELATATAVVGDPSGIVGERVDATESSIWWRLCRDGSRWVEVSPTQRQHTPFTLTNLPIGVEIEVAIRGSWWHGRARHVVASGLNTVYITAEPIVELTGTVSIRQHEGARQVGWTESHREPLPWQVASVGSGGNFLVQAPMERLASGRLVLFGEEDAILAQRVVNIDATSGIRF